MVVMTEIESISLKKSYFFAFIAVIGWGLSTTFVEFGLPYIDGQTFLAIRFIVATLIITPFILVTRKEKVIALFKSRWIYLIAIFETAGLITQYIAQESVSAGLTSLISMMFIVILPYLSYVFLSEKFHINHGIAIILGFIGVFLIVTEGKLENLGNSNAIGILILLFTALAYAFYQLFTSKLTRFVKPDIDSLSLFYVVMVIISILSLISALLFSNFNNIKEEVWIWIILLAIFSTIIAFTAYFEASKGIQANTLSIILVSQAIVPFFVDIFILQRDYSIWVYLGGIIVFFAMIVVGKTPINNIKVKSNKIDVEKTKIVDI